MLRSRDGLFVDRKNENEERKPRIKMPCKRMSNKDSIIVLLLKTTF